MAYPQRKLLENTQSNDLTMRSRARSNTALFRIGRWLPSAHTNLPRHGAPGATVFWCAAALPADAKYCETGAPAVGAGSRYSRCRNTREALRAGRGEAAAAQGGLRAAAATGEASARRRIHLLHRATRGRIAKTRDTRLAPAQQGGIGSQFPETLHPGGVPPGAGKAGPDRRAGASAGTHRSFGGHDEKAAKVARRTR